MRENDLRVIGEKGSDHEKKGKGKGTQCDGETEENSRDMFDEKNEGYKGRDKTVHGQQEIYMKE